MTPNLSTTNVQATTSLFFLPPGKLCIPLGLFMSKICEVDFRSIHKSIPKHRRELEFLCQTESMLTTENEKGG
jgi:hypothetical protein